MKKYIFAVSVCLPFLLLCSCGNFREQQDDDAYQHSLHNLQQQEEVNPSKFITVSGENWKNMIGQTVVKGVLTNNARLASFQDIRIKIDFYSKTGTLLETDEETIYINLLPGQKKKFKSKYFAPKGTQKTSLSVTGAKPAGN